jgi:hypothetical protein
VRQHVIVELRKIQAQVAELLKLLEQRPAAQGALTMSTLRTATARRRGPARRAPAAPSGGIEFQVACASCAPYCAFPNCPCTCHRAAKRA